MSGTKFRDLREKLKKSGNLKSENELEKQIAPKTQDLREKLNLKLEKKSEEQIAPKMLDLRDKLNKSGNPKMENKPEEQIAPKTQAAYVEGKECPPFPLQLLKFQTGPVVPRGPVPSAVDQSVPSPNVSTSTQTQLKANVTPQKSYITASIEQDPPTPTQDEPIQFSSYKQSQVNSSVTQSISMGEPLQPLQPVNRNPRRPATTWSYDPYYQLSITSTSVPQPTVPPYAPSTAFPSPGVPPPFVPPPNIPLVRPPIGTLVVPPVYQATLPPCPAVPVPAPQLNMPKPLSKTDFLEEKNCILREKLERPATTWSYDPYYQLSITSTSVPQPTVPPYAPSTAFPSPGVPPPFVPPPNIPLVRPPIGTLVVPPVYQATLPPCPAVPVPAPQLNMPKPLCKTDFLEEKNCILREKLEGDENTNPWFNNKETASREQEHKENKEIQRDKQKERDKTIKEKREREGFVNPKSTRECDQDQKSVYHIDRSRSVSPRNQRVHRLENGARKRRREGSTEWISYRTERKREMKGPDRIADELLAKLPDSRNSATNTPPCESELSPKENQVLNKNPELPAGWIEQKSKSFPDKVYYFNESTGESVWKLSDRGQHNVACQQTNGSNTTNEQHQEQNKPFGTLKVPKKCTEGAEKEDRTKELSNLQLDLPQEDQNKTKNPFSGKEIQNIVNRKASPLRHKPKLDMLGLVNKFGDARFRCYDGMGPVKIEQVIIGEKKFDIKLGGPPRRIPWGTDYSFEVFADQYKRGIMIDNILMYKFGEKEKNVIIRGRMVKLFYCGRPLNMWIDGQHYEIRVDAPPKSVNIHGKVQNIHIDGRDEMIFIGKENKGIYGGEPRFVLIDEECIEIRFDPPPRDIHYNGKSYELNRIRQQPCVNIKRVYHGIRFDGQSHDVFINDQLYKIPTDHAVKLKIGKRSHHIALGGPFHEFIVDGKWYEVKFNEAPKEIDVGNQILMIQLPGRQPEIEVFEIAQDACPFPPGMQNPVQQEITMPCVELPAKPGPTQPHEGPMQIQEGPINITPNTALAMSVSEAFGISCTGQIGIGTLAMQPQSHVPHTASASAPNTSFKSLFAALSIKREPETQPDSSTKDTSLTKTVPGEGNHSFTNKSTENSNTESCQASSFPHDTSGNDSKLQGHEDSKKKKLRNPGSSSESDSDIKFLSDSNIESLEDLSIKPPSASGNILTENCASILNKGNSRMMTKGNKAGGKCSPPCLTCDMLTRGMEEYRERNQLGCQAKNLVYVINCKICKKMYVGETKKSLKKRGKEHGADVRRENYKSSVSAHFNSNDHNGVSDMGVNILDLVKRDCYKCRQNKERDLIIHLSTLVPNGINKKVQGYKDHNAESCTEQIINES